MKQFYNRRERRAMARSFGLTNKHESEIQRRERVFRSIQAGRQIQQQFQGIVENERRNQLAEIEARTVRNLAFGVPLRYSKRALIKEATYKADGRIIDTPAEYKESEPVVFGPGCGEDEAARIVENNHKLSEKRRLDLVARRRRQNSGK